MTAVVQHRKSIQVQLAKVYTGLFDESVNYIVEPKYDGLRGVVIFSGQKGEAFTRTGLPVPNARLIVHELEESGQFKNQVLDGEFLATDWNLTASIVKTQDAHPKAKELRFYAFDIIPTKTWVAKSETEPLFKRKEILLSKLDCWYTKPTPFYPCKNIDALSTYLHKCLSAGFEGIMLKNYDAPYRFKKHIDWLKVKPISEDDFEIINAVEGKGKHKGRLGAIVVYSEIEWHGKKYSVTSEVGTGFTDEERDKFWNYKDDAQDTIIGKVVQVEFQEVTEDGALRFPVFKRLRIDK